jgi:protein gp37
MAAERSAIEWTEATWNPVTGCSKVSPGCAHCYAETLSLRFGYSNAPWTPANADANVVLHDERLEQPLRWRRPRLVFVNSMSDLFHELVPFSFVTQVFDVMARSSQHTFQVLTKRPERMQEYVRLHCDRVLGNVWLGVSIENARFTWRADALRETPAAVRFISAEPLLGSLFEPARNGMPLELNEVDWLIAGGESGPSARPVNVAWIRELRDACAEARVPFFFKQWGGRTAKAGGRLLDDRMHDAMPEPSRALEQIRLARA